MRPLPLVLLAGCAALAATGPDRSVLQVQTDTMDLPNPTLGEDTGHAYGFGDATAANALPDGWRTSLKEGKVTYAAGSSATHVTYTGAKGTVLSKIWPAQAGDSFVLTTTLDTGATRSHPGSIGVAFLKQGELVDYALHRLETEYAGTQPVEIRASAPVGTDQVAVRWVWTGDATKNGAFDIGPLKLTRVRAQSRAVVFPLQHVFLVTIETFRADHAGLYGYDRATTPNLARIAAQGAVFRNHSPQAPFTRPSLSSLVTSRYPVSLGITENVPPLPPEANTVAEMFADNGYVTGGFVAQFLLSAHYGFNQGFHSFYNHPNDTPASRVFQDLLPWIDAHTADNTFTWMHLFDPHGPYHPQIPKFQGDAIWQADTRSLTAGTGKLTGPFIPGYVLDPGDLERRHYVANYDSEIASVDQKVGELIDKLTTLGLADRSMVIITADHGESMTDHDRWFCHGSLYEHDLHVPLVVWAPGRVKPGTVVEARTTHLDLVPTMLDYAGAKAPPGLKGKSLRGLLDGGTAPTQAYSVAVVGEGEEEQVAIGSDSPLKVIVDHSGNAVEAYDLAKDPNELVNVATTRKAEVDPIVTGWRAWMATQLADDERAKPAPTRTMSEEEEEKLRALGYVE
jgi:arylsulfatase A-like enzyme